ncbi:MAG: hypothetical protein ACOYJH_02970 [Anaerovoracaceae bacterium]|jgi:hypothetical protein
MLRGITVRLKQKVQTGVDPFNHPTFEESWVDVDNVLIGEPSADDINTEINLTGKQVAYTLAIPKGDDHVWTDTEVKFFGEEFRTIGAPVQGIEDMIPLDWNKKVKVERYG